MHKIELQKIKLFADEVLLQSKTNSLPIDVLQLCSFYNVKLQPYNIANSNIRELLNETGVTLFFSGSKYILYYDENIRNSDYLIIKTLCRYLLDTIDNNITINLNTVEILTIFLMSPPVILKKINVDKVFQIEYISNIPPHIIHEYLDILVNPISTNLDKYIINNFSFFTLKNKINSLLWFFSKKIEQNTDNLLKSISGSSISNEHIKPVDAIHDVYLNDGDNTYHEYNCKCIRDKVDVNRSNVRIEKEKNHKPCNICKPDKTHIN